MGEAAGRLERVLAGEGPGVELELIAGELFTSAPPTAYLSAVIARAVALLEECTAAGPAARVVSQEPVVLGPDTVVRPDAALLAADGSLRLVVEVRTESTDRYALGAKRMAYARAGVPEYWFVDPRAGKVLVLRLPAGDSDYAWPADERSGGDVIASSVCPGLQAPVARFVDAD